MDPNPTPSGDQKPAKASLFSRAPKPAKPPAPREPKTKRPRRAGLASLSAVFSFLLVGVVVALAGFVAVLLAERRPGPLAEDKVVVLTREDDDGPIADQLEKAGVIENSTIFAVMTLFDGQRSALKRGEYDFRAGISMREVEDMLARHKVVRHKLPIPEGLTSEQIVQRIRDSDLFSGEVKETPREGSLYPDTYVFERGDSRNALIAHMEAEQTRMVDEIWRKRSPDLPIKSPGELVTLASIVEKETGRSDERPRVASVFVNRLQKHMKLQSDPTIVYGLVFGKGTLGHSITKTELQEATPYNTYFIDGLPPGPICNPGKAAMEAVANPAKGHDLFFVADGTGGHAFAETLDQHAKNVARWRQIEKDAKDAKDRLSPDVAPPSNIRGEAPDMGSSRYGQIDSAPAQTALSAFGALGFAPDPSAPPATAALVAKLAKVADSRRKVAALTGSGGSLSAAKLGGGIDQLIVTGVNDPSPGADDDSFAPIASGPVASSPLSPAALADLKARAARYGGGQLATADVSAVPEPVTAGPVPSQSAGGRPRAFDASEGTKLDPLRSKGWDLSSAKDVPNALLK
jgi:UPF0755 protein